jgi:hypothetical protein
MLFYSLTISSSAFLLFVVQPIIAKMILPWFGGSSAVWSTCMLFFQVVLLLGYLYAHWLHGKWAARKQALVHIALLAVSLAALPMLPNPAWKSAGNPQPSLRILGLLAVTVGLPYLLLSSTSPLLQAWYARTHKRGLPYRFFALSNFASMVALLSYPPLIEPNVSTHMQGMAWSALYICFAALCAITAWRSSRMPGLADQSRQTTKDDGVPHEPAWMVRLLWLGLAAGASTLLLAVTTHLTQDIAAIPFLWILPLSVYLLSFIICFEAPQIYWRPVFLPLLAAALWFMAYRLWPERAWKLTMRPAIALFAASLFVCCMVSHGELGRLKAHPHHLTSFYVSVSLGGAVGGIFVGFVAPNLFHAYYEFPIGLALCAALAFLVLARALARFSKLWKIMATGVLLCALGGYLWFLGVIMREMVAGYRVVTRNFYGQLRVEDYGDPRINDDAARALIHGTINHGEQPLRERYRREPITYFCPESGVGRAMRALEGAPRRIGILGLGCGTLAAYGREGDILRIYEINPLVMDIARTQFTYIGDAAAKVEVTLGDGRLSLESELTSQQFDILIMDAFSGDSVPVHLLTREALRTYFRHLKPNGILAVNITNSYLDLRPVVERAAASFGKKALVYEHAPPDEDQLCFYSVWALILDAATLDSHPKLGHEVKVLAPFVGFRVWTDDFSNMYSILK